MIECRFRPAALACAILASQFAVQAQAQALEPATFVIPTVSFTFVAAYVAEDKNLFEKHGLKITIRNILGIGALNAVISGGAEFTHITGGSFTRAAARGQKLLAIANTIDRPMVELILRKDLAAAPRFDPAWPIEKRGSVLRGTTISAGGVNSILHGFMRIVAIRAGLDPERDVRMAPMEAASVLPAFANRTIDGFVLSQPWTEQVKLDGDGISVASIPNGDFPEMVPFGYNLVVTRPEVCAKRRSLCEKMGAAMSAAVNFIHDNPGETLEILKKRFPKVAPELVVVSFNLMKAATPRPPAVRKADLENSEIYNILAGLMKPAEKLPTYDGLYTEEFVR